MRIVAMRGGNSSRKLISGVALILALHVPVASVEARKLTVLHAFQGGSDGANPVAGLLADGTGNFFGTTAAGGGTGCGGAGCGTVFEVSSQGTETVLYSFKGGGDGAYPYAPLAADQSGDLYGTTNQGGGTNCSSGCGTVFELTPDGTETVLYSFNGGSDGAYPYAGLMMDKSGNLIGTTAWAGGHGRGTVFEVAPGGTETVLYSFPVGYGDAKQPYGGVVTNTSGNLIGTSYLGGGHRSGAIYELTSDGSESVIHGFRRKNDGDRPYATPILDSAGNLYGTTVQGGLPNCSGLGCGTVYELTPDGRESLLYSFSGGNDGSYPFGGVIRGASGNFYGTTTAGGANGVGTIFELRGGGAETVLYAFTGGSDGNAPYAGLLKDKAGNLFGTTSLGGGGTGCTTTGCGVVFELTT